MSDPTNDLVALNPEHASEAKLHAHGHWLNGYCRGRYRGSTVVADDRERRARQDVVSSGLWMIIR